MTRTEATQSDRQKRFSWHNRPDWRRVAFPLAAILLALLPFLILEGMLRALDVGNPQEADSAGFDGSRLFALDEDGEVYSTARHRLLYFGSQEFSAEKPDKAFRIFGLGGSTVHGRPYANGSSFVKWMEIELRGRDSNHEYETVNCGGLSYASYRLTTLLDEVLGYDPDLIVIATGHNEFLEDRTYRSEKNRSAIVRWAAEKGSQLRTVSVARQFLHNAPDEPEDVNDRSRLAPDVEARLDDQSGYASYRRDEVWRRNVVDQYEESLRKMVDDCRSAEVPLILVNLGDNLRDCPPFKSEHRNWMPAESLQQWQVLFDEATGIDKSDPERALALYRKAEAIDDEYALLAFRMARCEDRLGRFDRAKEYYVKARQLDICPLRMLEELHERLKRVAQELDVPLVDAEALAASESPDGIPGNNCFMDHVHPNIGSHQQIGRLLADQVESMGLVAPNRKWTDALRRRAYRNHFRRLGPAYLANGRRRVGWLENWARRERLDKEAEPVDARGHLHLGKKRLDYGEVDAAWEQFAFAIDKDPGSLEKVFDYAFGLFTQGRPKLCEDVLVRLHREPIAGTYRPAIELAYALVALDAGETRRAETIGSLYGQAMRKAVTDPRLERWVSALPDVSDPMEALLARRSEPADIDLRDDPFRLPGMPASVASGAPTEKSSKVAELLDRAIARNPESASLHLNRARIRFAKQAYDAALSDVTRSLELEPENIEALKFRAILCMIQDDVQTAVADLTAAIKLDANAPDLLRMRAAAYRRLGDDAKADADLQAAEELSPGK